MCYAETNSKTKTQRHDNARHASPGSLQLSGFPHNLAPHIPVGLLTLQHWTFFDQNNSLVLISSFGQIQQHQSITRSVSFILIQRTIHAVIVSNSCSTDSLMISHYLHLSPSQQRDIQETPHHPVDSLYATNP